MKKKSRIVTIVSRLINFKSWLDWERVKTYTLYLLNGIKRLVIVQKKQEESFRTQQFSKVQADLQLSNEELKARQQGLLRLCMVMLMVAVLLLGYAIYHLYYFALEAFVISLTVGCIALVLAFRYHFWYFQIKERKLGCTIGEWYRYGIRGKKT